MSAFKQLAEECANCKLCSLAETRTNTVFGVGNETAEIVFIGEGPGAEEDKRGEPFVGRAGKLLDDMLRIIGLSRTSNIYIANIVKCRPPDNRDPHPSERAACFRWLTSQLEIIKPKIIVCLGRVAAVSMISEDFKITRDHGKWYDKHGAKIMAIYHPAALLRDPFKKPDTFVDLKLLQSEIQEICKNTKLECII